MRLRMMLMKKLRNKEKDNKTSAKKLMIKLQNKMP